VLTAGIVGALIASAIAAIATHAADSISNPPKADPTPPRAAAAEAPTYPTSPEMRAALSRVAAALVTVEATAGSARTTELGVIIRAGGMLLAPSRGIAGSQSLQVILADGAVYVGSVVGIDPRSGLAVIHINGATDLPTVTLSRAAVVEPSVVLALSTPGETRIAIGAVHETNEIVRVDGTALVGAMRTDFPSAYCPSGSALLNSAGAIDGLAVGDSGGAAVIAPAWLASNVARDLIAAGTVIQGWLGLRGVTDSLWPGGVRIVSLSRSSALRHDGVRPGDVIFGFGTVRIRSMEDLRARLYGLRPGVRVSLQIDEGGAMVRRSVALAATANP
jgi:S1-C subfamily serine protease